MKCVAFQLFIIHYVLLVASKVIILPSACGNHIYDINTSSIFSFHLAFFYSLNTNHTEFFRNYKPFFAVKHIPKRVVW